MVAPAESSLVFTLIYLSHASVAVEADAEARRRVYIVGAASGLLAGMASSQASDVRPST